MTSEDFKTTCTEVAQRLDLGEVLFFEESERSNDAFHDDGTLHVQHGFLRACFDVSNGQDLSGWQQNENTEAVMNALGLAVTSRVLVDDSGEGDADDDEDEVGNDWWGDDEDEEDEDF